MAKDVVLYDGGGSPIQKQRADPLAELGVTGLKRYGLRSQIDEEFLTELRGERARRVYREMRDNDPVIGAVFYAIEMLLRNVTWRVEGEDEEQVEFLEGCVNDMSHTWEDFIAEVLSMATFGYSWHEVVYKKRNGDNRDPGKRSKFADGRYGWRKMPIRSQDSFSEWGFDEEGGIQAFIQVAPPDYHEVTIPIQRSLLFRTGLHKGNPEGRSLLRNAYRPWWIKKNIEEIESIGIERDLAGMPVFWRTAEMAKQYDGTLKVYLRNLRNDEQNGLLLPLAYDEAGNKILDFQLMSAPGSKQIDVGAAIERWDKRIAMTCLAQFILLGMDKVGSFALSSSMTNLFATALGAILDSIAAPLNRHGVPRLLALNGMKTDKAPKLVPGDVESPDLKDLGAYITALAGAGAPLFPDDDLENYLRQAANWPEKPEEPAAGPSPLPKPKEKPELPEGTE
jgi:hypothetical protein